MIPRERFYVPNEGPARQGDILLAGVARLIAEDRFTPPAWNRLDAYDVTVSNAGRPGRDMRIAAGPALVMITSHDSHFDKEWNARRTTLIKQGVPEAEAERQADGFDLEAVVGRQIENVTMPMSNPILVELRLDDGTTISLLQQPGEPEQGPSRTNPPGSVRS